MSSYRGRFAPSPTGALHFGSLVAAFGSWLRARAAGGAWLVRIEDVDRGRSSPIWSEAALATLSAFGLVPDGPVVRQSERTSMYVAALDRLRQAGFAYACACTRNDLVPFGGVHPSRCVRVIDPDLPHAWRLRVPAETIAFEDAVYGHVVQPLRNAVGDFVLQRANGEFAYQFAVVVDDAEQGISEVVRGADLLESTPRQVFLRRLLGFADTGWLHLPLVLDAQGRKLAKRDAAHPLDSADPVPALRHALAVLGQAAPATSRLGDLLAEATERFDVTRIPSRHPPDVALQDD